MRFLVLLGCASLLAAAVDAPDLSLGFERNSGVTSAHFFARAGSHTVWLSPQDIMLASSVGSLELRFVDANPAPVMDALDPLPGRTNYIIGRDPARWVTGVRTYARVRYRELYPGIDLICHGSAGSFEYDFEVRAGADPARIRLSLGEGQARLGRDGSLILADDKSEWRHHAPHVYQEGREISGHYVLQPHGGEFGFEIGAYNRTQTLVIDPVVVQASYIPDIDSLTALAVDSAGNIYLTGWTNSANFPVTQGAYDTHQIGGPCPVSVSPYGTQDAWCSDVFVTKLNPAGTAMIYSTYIGGTGNDRAFGIAADKQGNAYVTGWTDSTDLPVTAGALRTSQSGGYLGEDAFLFQLDPTGATLLYSTYIGGTQDDQGTAIVASASGDLYVAGTTYSADFPIYAALQAQQGGGDCSSFFFIDNETKCGDAFLMHWRIPGMTLVYSTYLGGESNDAANAVALDTAGNVYLAGQTYSSDFPLSHPLQSAQSEGSCLALNTQNTSACADAFVAKINSSGTLVYSTYLGGSSSDLATGIAADTQGNAYVTGTTYSADFPAVNAIQDPVSGACRGIWGAAAVPCSDAFVTKITAEGNALIYSTYIGPSNNSSATAIAVDGGGNAFVAGYTPSYVGFPITSDALVHCNGAGSAAFLTEFGPNGSLAYSTFFTEGIAAMAFGTAGLYVAGQPEFYEGGPLTTGLPTTPQTVQTSFGDIDAYSAPMYVALLDLAAAAPGPAVDPGCVVNAAGYQNSAAYAAGYVAPGEIVVIFGQALGPTAGAGATVNAAGYLPTNLGGVSVTFSGMPAPMLYAGANQVNAIVPFEVTGQTEVQVHYQGATSAPVEMQVAEGEPAFFTWGAAGTGQTAALNQDGSLNSASNPAARGSIVSIWATGFGAMSPAYPDGLIVRGALSQLVPAPNVFVGGLSVPATIQYGGQAPDLVAGAVQINFVVPQDAPIGPATGISFLSPDFRIGFMQGVTIAIQ
jgi:uncharacterized protein (TIGR03437 family)